MTYPLLQKAPTDHHSLDFLQYLKENNQVLWEDDSWLVIKNCKYGHPTAFAKQEDKVDLQGLVEQYGQYEWKVHAKEKQSVRRFHIHILNTMKPTPPSNMEKQRSSNQNRSLHKALTEIADNLTEQGIERRTIIEDLEGYSAPITMEFLKEVYKTICYTMYRTTSTSDLTTKQMMDSWDVFSKFLGENYGQEYYWPSADMLAFEDYYDKQ